MQHYEYRAVVAPARAEKIRGLKTTAERFAHTVSVVMNDMARDGWEYLRADILPCEERSGLTGRSTVHHTLLVFRRPVAANRDASTEPVPLIAGPGPADAAAIPSLHASAPQPGAIPSPGIHSPAEQSSDAASAAAPRVTRETGPLGHAAALARAFGSKTRVAPWASEEAKPRAPRLVATAKEGSPPPLGAAPDDGKQG